MINLEKIKWKSVSPLLLRKTALAPYFYPFLKFFRVPTPDAREVIKMYCHPLKRGGWFKLWRKYVFDLILVSISSSLIRTGGRGGIMRVFVT